MARKFTMLDEDSGIEVAVSVDTKGNEARPGVWSVVITATGDRPIQPADLLALESMGLKLPNGQQDVTYSAIREEVSQAIPEGVTAVDGLPAKKARPPAWMGKAAQPVKKTAAKTTPMKRPGSGIKKRPTDAVLVADIKRLKGNARELAAVYEISMPTAYAWIAEVRKKGLLGEPTTVELPGNDQQ